MQSDAEYFHRRGREERKAALAAQKATVRSRHLEFAEAYELRAHLLDVLCRQSAPEVSSSGSPEVELLFSREAPLQDRGPSVVVVPTHEVI